MKPKHLPTIPFVFVEWDDAWKSAVNDTTLETAKDEHRPMDCLNAGWLIHEDEQGIQLASECSPNGTFRHLAFVPRAIIKRVIPVKISFPRRDDGRTRIQQSGATDGTGQPA